MRSQMTISVQVFENGQLVKKQVPTNHVEIEIDRKSVKLSDLISRYDKRVADLEKKTETLKSKLIEVVKADKEWKEKTNNVLASILKTLKEQGEII